MDENMVPFCRLRDLSGHLCLLFAVLTFAADVIGRKWVRIGIDLLIFLYQFPLWVLAGVVLLLIFPGWAYSPFPGMWFYSGFLLWCVPHGFMAAKAFRKKDWIDFAGCTAGICAIGCFAAFLHLLDLTKNAA